MDLSYKFDTVEEKEDFLKTRIESLGLSKQTKYALTKANIFTVRGLTNRKLSSLATIKGLGVNGIKEITIMLNDIVPASDFKRQSLFSESYATNSSLSKNDQVITPQIVDIDNKDIVEIFAKYFGLNKVDIESVSRKKETVAVRDLIVYFLREYGELSFPAIGRSLGNRDHTTMMHSYKKIKNNIASEKDFEIKFAELITKAGLIKERDTDKVQIVVPQEVESIYLQKGLQSPKFKEIYDRDKKILELYRSGLTLEKIGQIIKVTRERVRQIVKSVIKQISINESISRDFEVDYNFALAEEKRKRDFVKNQNKPARIVRQKINSQNIWSRHYPACQLCGTTTVPHFIRGLCENCGKKSISGGVRENIITEHKDKCDRCGMTRDESYKIYGRDFYLSRLNKSVLCQKCHRIMTGTKLGKFRKDKWKMFYK